MAEMTSAERVMCTLRREQADRVPHFEWLIDKRVREALCPGSKDHNDFAVRMDHDAVLVGPRFQSEPAGPNRFRSEWGYIYQTGTEEHGIEVQSPIQTLEDFERYAPPDVHPGARYTAIEDAVHAFKGKKAIGVHLNDVFSLPRYLMGMENLLLAVAMDPDLVRALVNFSVDINLEMAKEAAFRGADFIWTGDDYACNNGPLMSPEAFRDLLFEPLCRVIGGFRELGLPVIKHTDGNLWSILDMIIASGISCLDPIDPQAGMDLAEVKAAYGHVVALKGNVDCAHTLTFGTVEDVVEETRAVLRAGMPGGGFILSSSNSIHSAVKPENYAAMMDTLKQYGRYA